MTTHETQPETFAREPRSETAAREKQPDSISPLDTNREDTQPETVNPVVPDAQAAPVETDSARFNEPAETMEPIRETDGPAMDLEPRHGTDEPIESEGSGDQILFADSDLSGLRARWTEVQSAFVDDPRDCVQKADGLVADVVDKLTAGFSQARSHLEEQWDRGEQVSTEDLRVALTRYRDFFERLLAV